MTGTRGRGLRGGGGRPAAGSGRWLIGVLVLIAAYYPAARLGLLLAFRQSNITPVWPPTGIAIAGLLLLGRRAWPAVTLGALLVNWTTGLAAPVAAGLAAGNTLEAVVSVWILERAGFHRELDRVRDVVILVVAGGCCGPLAAATIGTASLAAGGAVPLSDAPFVWAVYLVGDAMGALVITSLILAWASGWRRALGRDAAAALERSVLVLALAAGSAWVFSGGAPPYVLLPLLAWAAVRAGQAGAATGALLISAIATWQTAHGAGPFAHPALTDRLIELQLFVGAVALTGLALATASAAQGEAEARERVQAADLRTERERFAFTNMAAHELRTPLSVLRGYVDMLGDGSLGEAPPPWRRPLGVVRDQADRLGHLVDDLLMAARSGQGRVPVELGAVDATALAREAAERARPRLELLGGALALAGAGGPVPADADAGHVAKILDNLVNNAMTYSDAAPHVGIEVGSGDGQTWLAVTDRGRGIDPELHQRIFDEFFRVQDGHSPSAAGSGLGLFISRGLAEAMGGSLAVESSVPDAGSRFVLRLRSGPPPQGERQGGAGGDGVVGGGAGRRGGRGRAGARRRRPGTGS